jgi:hypothetical protein
MLRIMELEISSFRQCFRTLMQKAQKNDKEFEEVA